MGLTLDRQSISRLLSERLYLCKQEGSFMNSISSPKQFHTITVNSEMLSQLISTCYICVTQMNLERNLFSNFCIVLSLKKGLKNAVKIHTILSQYQNGVMIKLTCQKLLFWRLQHIKSIKMLLFLLWHLIKRWTKRPSIVD